MRGLKPLFGLCVVVILVSCGQAATGGDGNYVMPTPRPPMTLAPTFTPASTQAPLPTITPPSFAQETAVLDTPIPFDETVIQLWYQIPMLGVNRRLQGNVANQLILVDENSGRSVQRNNEGGVMFELRQALSNMELASLPEGCQGCVYVAYEITDAGLSGAGWLQDPVVLASIENFMSASLGPHFPAGTVIGLRRSASPFTPGHSIAITEDGRLWMWLATESDVSAPVGTEAVFPALAELAQLPFAELDEKYEADCRGVPIETLSLTQNGDTWQGRIVCPELTLPTTLQPLYIELDKLVAEKTADVTATQPESAFPVDALLQYSRSDDSMLKLFTDSTLIATDPFGGVFTSTLTSTLPISLTSSILETGVLGPGYQSFMATEPVTTTVTAEPPTFVLAVRGPDGVYDGEWPALPNFEILRELNSILNRMISDSGDAEFIEETPVSVDATPENGEDAESSSTEVEETPSPTTSP